jgi:hypothetical protein
MSHDKLIAPKDAPLIADRLGVSVHTVLSWRQRKSIPAEKWPAFIEAGFATLDDLAPELAEAVAKSPEVQSQDAA